MKTKEVTFYRKPAKYGHAQKVFTVPKEMSDLITDNQLYKVILIPVSPAPLSVEKEI
jgi:hypothetical protein